MRRIAALSLEMRSRSAAISCLSPVGTIHLSILPDPARNRVRTRPPDAVRRPESEPGSGPPPGRAGADDGARRIRRGNLDISTC